ncbi:3-oxoacyl-ACP reductase family protein [Arenibaculum pallidiluteum]|uniref:3-oxoacyl-ACP reductase family protein n=1 Tax=Arenibaculum pallidiluteum TaxID=2812559 RepID=UPI001A961D11|nr:3-oxoacyl-ACP reductase family protein [Arenibaculum pallidiluteum]
MADLSGKVALVTGGSRGIGAAITRRLAADGAAVALTYARATEEARAVAAGIASNGGSAVPLAADNRDPAAVEAAVEQTVAELGRLDILVNNAGIFVAKPLQELTLRDFEESIAINLRAAFIASQAAARHMGDGGRIISIGSSFAQRVPGPGVSLYALSKAGIIGMTKGMARDLGSRGITVNVVHPGSTDTDMNPADSRDADLQRARMAIPRFGDPRDVAGLVAWLAGAEARSVTGAEFTIDGGANT